MRLAPLALLAIGIVLISTTLGEAWVWGISAVSVVALIVLLFVMYRAGQFRGPSLLLDDARERLQFLSRVEEGEHGVNDNDDASRERGGQGDHRDH